MANFFTGLVSSILGALLVQLAFWFRYRRKKKAEDLRFAEMKRHSDLAEKALIARNYEAYEFHMREAASYFKEPTK